MNIDASPLLQRSSCHDRGSRSLAHGEPADRQRVADGRFPFPRSSPSSRFFDRRPTRTSARCCMTASVATLSPSAAARLDRRSSGFCTSVSVSLGRDLMCLRFQRPDARLLRILSLFHSFACMVDSNSGIFLLCFFDVALMLRRQHH
jgi:hypothetical protein